MGADQSKGGAGKVGLADFDMVRLVGKGAFGKVWEVRKKDTGETFAMKELSKKSVIQQNLVEHTVTERNVMLLCENPFIINLYFAFQTEEKLYFVLDFVAGGSLFELFSKVDDGYLPEETVRLYAAEILLGIEELHQKGIVYRDMKLENILIGEDGHVVLTDFGLSAIVQDGKVHSFSGTAIYIAPEVLDDKGHGKSVDWWGYGVLLHVLLTGAPVFWSDNKKELFDMIRDQTPVIDDPILSSEARDLIVKLLDRNVETRLGCGPQGAEELKRHPFFRSLNWKAVLKKKLKPALMPERFEMRSAPGPVMDADAPQAPMEYKPGNRLLAVKDKVHFQNFSFSYQLEPAPEADKVAAALGPGGNELRSSSDTIAVASPQEVLSSTFSDDSVLLRKKRKKRNSTRVASLRLPNVAMFRAAEDPRKPKSAGGRRRVKSVNPHAATIGASAGASTAAALAAMELDEQKLALLRSEASKGNRNRQFIEVGDSSTQAESLSLELNAAKVESGKKKFAPLSARANKNVSRRHRRTRSVGTEDLAKIAKAEHGSPPAAAAAPASAPAAPAASADRKVATACHGCGSTFRKVTLKRKCKKCKHTFCQKCANKKKAAPQLGYTTAVRFCRTCYQTL